MTFPQDTPFERLVPQERPGRAAKVVVAGLRSLHGGSARALRRACAACDDWDGVLDFADVHRVVPAFREALKTSAADLAPAQAVRAIDARFRTNAQQNLILASELIRLSNLFGERGLRVVPFKGPALAVQAYGGLTMRQSGDLDLFVEPEGVREAVGLLEAEGYVCDTPAERVGFSPAHMRGRRELNFVRKWGPAEIHAELKWRAGEFHLPWHFDSRALETVSLAGGETVAFTAAETLLYLCHHGSRHMWQRLSWILDVAKFVAAPADDAHWRGVLRSARERGCLRNLLIAASLANRLCGAAPPRAVEAALVRDPKAGALARRLVPWILSPEEKPLFKHYHSFHVDSRERFGDRATIWAAWLWDAGRLDRAIPLKR